MTRFLSILVLLSLTAAIPLSIGYCAERDGGEVSRFILGVLNNRGAEGQDLGSSGIHTLFEKPLNHYGFIVDYADVNEPLPDFTPYRAIIVWLSSDEMDRPEAFLPWLKDAMDSGVRLILPNGLQAPYKPGGQPVHQNVLAEIFDAFGLALASYEMPGDLGGTAIRNVKPGNFNFETSLVNPEMLYPVFLVLRQSREGADVWQRIETAGDPERHAVSVAVGGAGFFALHEDLLYYSIDVPEHGYRVSWNINPFAVLDAVLDCADMPRPDITTFWGSRGAYFWGSRGHIPTSTSTVPTT